MNILKDIFKMIKSIGIAIKQVLTRLYTISKQNRDSITLIIALLWFIYMFYNLHTGDLLQALYSFLTVTVFIGISILLELMEINQRGGR